jgi:hypothetical protein
MHDQFTSFDTVEQYRDIEGFTGYRVGSHGTVWSRRRFGRYGGLAETWRRMKPNQRATGYLLVGLCHNGVMKPRFVHRLVLAAFVGPRPEGMEGCHNDGNPANNMVENLRWDTRKGNFSDKVAHGTHNRGERHNMVRITEADVHEIRRLYATGHYTHADIGKMFLVSKQHVGDILRGKKWKWLVTSG